MPAHESDRIHQRIPTNRRDNSTHTNPRRLPTPRIRPFLISSTYSEETADSSALRTPLPNLENNRGSRKAAHNAATPPPSRLQQAADIIARKHLLPSRHLRMTTRAWPAPEPRPGELRPHRLTPSRSRPARMHQGGDITPRTARPEAPAALLHRRGLKEAADGGLNAVNAHQCDAFNAATT